MLLLGDPSTAKSQVGIVNSPAQYSFQSKNLFSLFSLAYDIPLINEDHLYVHS